MANIPEILQRAFEHHQAGRFAFAEQLYQEILQVQPEHAIVLHQLGVLAAQMGNQEFAIAYLRQALQAKPDFAEAHSNLGNILRDAGKLDEAIVTYQRALELRPDFADAYCNLGNALRKQGKLDEALDCFHRALKLKPNFAFAHCNLGLALMDQDKFDEAVPSLHRALELQPNFADAHSDLGNAFRALGKFNEAIDCYRRALELKPNFTKAHYNLGVSLRDANRLVEAIECFQKVLALDSKSVNAYRGLGVIFSEQDNLDEAIACFRVVVELEPVSAKAQIDLGNVYVIQGKLENAIRCFRRAVALDVNHAEAYLSLGNALRILGIWDESASCLFRALELKPNYLEANGYLASVLSSQGKLDEAVKYYRRALELKQDDVTQLGFLIYTLQQLCWWEDIEKLSLRLIEYIQHTPHKNVATAPPPFVFMALPIKTTAEQHMCCAKQWIKQRLQGKIHPIRLSTSQSLVSYPKVSIGYLSSDFHTHATAFLIAELFEKHNRERFEITAYSTGPDDNSSMRKRLSNAVDHFVDLEHLSVTESVKRIANDQIDILIDLKGFTANNRVEILAHRPAPIQVNYLGYPGTMGADFIDYILVDDFIVPSEQQTFYSEKLVHLPGCYQVNDSQREISTHRLTRVECGLPEKSFVFCSFNGSYKITAEMFNIWMEVLRELPDSVLWLWEINPLASANLRKEAVQRGVSAERLIFAPNLPMPEHLARYRLADLFLDTFPVNAHTTASDALWAGCPLLTLAGETFISRVAGSLLREVGLSELITTSFEAYKKQAVYLARNPAAMNLLRERLKANSITSTLFNSEHFARKIEAAYSTMWENYLNGEPPRAFRVTDADLKMP